MDKVNSDLSRKFLLQPRIQRDILRRFNLICLFSIFTVLSIESSGAENSLAENSSAASNLSQSKINSLASSNTDSASSDANSASDTNSASDANSAGEANSTPRKVEVEKWDFGVVTDRSGATKDWKLHPVVLIPNLAGVQYAWKIKTNSHLPIFVREEFTLPEPPSTWKLRQGGTSELKNGGEQCILESFQSTDDGWIGHAWTASHGDPPGKYEIKVWLNGKLAHDFLFNVGEAPQLENSSRDW